ncbi:MAG: hypothetical protein AAGA27_05170 [Pseudomonadota bacterium]
MKICLSTCVLLILSGAAVANVNHQFGGDSQSNDGSQASASHAYYSAINFSNETKHKVKFHISDSKAGKTTNHKSQTIGHCSFSATSVTIEPGGTDTIFINDPNDGYGNGCLQFSVGISGFGNVSKDVVDIHYLAYGGSVYIVHQIKHHHIIPIPSRISVNWLWHGNHDIAPSISVSN